MKKIPRTRPTRSTLEAALDLCVSETTVKRLVRRGTLHATKPKKFRGHWASFIIVDKAFMEEQRRRLNGLKSPRRKHIPNPSSRHSSQGASADNLNLNPTIDPRPIQTVPPPAEPQPAFLVSARGYLATWHLPQPTLYIRHNTATFNFDGEAERLGKLVARAENAMDICQEAADACRLHKDSALKCAAHVDEMDNAIRKWRDQEASYHQKCENSAMKCQGIKDSITRYQNEVDTWAMEKVRAIQASELTCTRCTAILAAACILQLLLAAYYTLCHFNII